MSWFNDSHRHALARLGIKTAHGQQRTYMGKPLPKQKQNGRKRASKQQLTALDNQLQTHVHKMSGLSRRLAERGRATSEDMVALQSSYDSARVRVLEYQDLKGSLPYWTSRDWVGSENWRGGGRVKGLLEKARTTSGEKQKQALRELDATMNRPKRL